MNTASDHTLTANWIPNQYIISYDTADGTAIQPTTYTFDVKTETPTNPSRSGYDFIGWKFYNSDTGAEINYSFGSNMLAHNITAVAQWSYKTFYYDSGESDKRIDASHEYNHDSFKIEDLVVFMREGYKLEFKIDLYMKEEDEGYQEIYLRNSNGVNIAGNSEFAHGGGGKDGWGWENFTFAVDGENCTETMYLRYGAHGNYSDDWIRRRAIVTVRVIPE